MSLVWNMPENSKGEIEQVLNLCEVHALFSYWQAQSSAIFVC